MGDCHGRFPCQNKNTSSCHAAKSCRLIYHGIIVQDAGLLLPSYHTALQPHARGA